MPSLRQISVHFPAVVLDASSSAIQLGILQPDGAATWQTSTDEAGVAVFRLADSLGLKPKEIGTFIFCEGPGSVLGIRTTAMALRTWCVLEPRPVFAYSSLAVVAHAAGRADLGVIADARRDTWHLYDLAGGLRRIPADQLRGELVMPENFRHWSPLPPHVGRVPYVLADLLPRIWDVDLLRATDAPDAFLHEEPSYVTWTPQIHRAAQP